MRRESFANTKRVDSLKGALLRDILSLVVMVASVAVGAVLINTFIFRSFDVVGASMEATMHTGDRLIVNRLPVTVTVTVAVLRSGAYIPERGQIIVFHNPHYVMGSEDQFIVKRVIGLPGDRVLLRGGTFTVYNLEHPGGFDPDATSRGEPQSPTSGEVDVVVPAGELFVAGDHRAAGFSMDSRNELGTVPLYDVVGPVAFRVYPFNKMRAF